MSEVTEPDQNSRGQPTSDQPLPEKQLSFLKKKGIAFERCLGNSTYGDVWVVRETCFKWKGDHKYQMDRPLVCKILTLKSANGQRSTKEFALDVVREADLYCDLNHLNVIKRTDVINMFGENHGFPEPMHVLVFMGLMEGSLHSLINTEFATKNPEWFTQKWCKQILSGLKYLHENNIFHSNIKPANILYTTHEESDGTAFTFKLTDFGLNFKFEAKHPTVTGKGKSTDYTAPELLSLSPCDRKIADIYSLGVTMAESISAGKWPIDQVINRVRNSDETISELKISPYCAGLIAMMIEEDPTERADMVAVKNHIWIKHFFPQ